MIILSALSFLIISFVMSIPGIIVWIRSGQFLRISFLDTSSFLSITFFSFLNSADVIVLLSWGFLKYALARESNALLVPPMPHIVLHDMSGTAGESTAFALSFIFLISDFEGHIFFTKAVKRFSEPIS